MNYNCFVSFLCGVMFLPAIGMVYILSLPLPSAAVEIDVSKPSILTGMENGSTVVVWNGVGPDGKMAPIRVDGDGHVICSAR